MKFIYLLLLLIKFFDIVAQPAQDSLRDRHWFLSGYQELVFDNNTTTGTIIPNMPFILETNASICDTAGNLLFYTNGIFLFDRLHRRMPGVIDTLSPGYYAYLNSFTGYRLQQGAMILPDPINSSLYHIFHMDVDDFNILGGNNAAIKHVYETIVDIGLNNGFGGSISRRVLWQDTLGANITATRHANGRDWWLVFKRFKVNEMKVFLLNEIGTQEVHDQLLGSTRFFGIGQSSFSPTGDKFVDYNTVSERIGQNLNIYDFDRCSGLLSNAQQCIWNDTAFASGCAISPNGRWLYVSSYKYLYQLDLQAPDICASKRTVHTVDMTAPYPLPFYLCQLGPDGRIYISSQRPDSSLHLIEHPDLQCPACGVRASVVGAPAFPLISYNNYSVPNFPYFKLGALSGSGCDTLLSAVTSPTHPPKPTVEIGVFPNPTDGVVRLSVPDGVQLNEVRVYDSVGRLILSKNENNWTNLDVSTFPNGIYLLEFWNEQGKLGCEKLVKQ